MENWPSRGNVQEAILAACFVAETPYSKLGREMAIILRDEIERLVREAGLLNRELNLMLSRAVVDAEAWKRDDAIRQQLLIACQAQHEAIDILFSRLIMSENGFLPSRSGQPWEAMVLGNEAIKNAKNETRDRQIGG